MNKTSPQAYSLEDLCRINDEGRSVRDDASQFYEDVMKLQTSLAKIPSSTEVVISLHGLPNNNDKMNRMIDDLKVTPLSIF